MTDRAEAAQREAAEKSGIPWEPFTDRDKREADAYGAAMAAVAAMHICGVVDSEGIYYEAKQFDTCDTKDPATGRRVPQGDMILQMLASQRLETYHRDCREDGEQLLDTRRAPGYDPTDSLTLTRLYMLFNRDRHAVALETPYDWRSCVREELGRIDKCDVHLLNSCYDRQATPAKLALVYKRGEYVFAWKICSECLDALSWIDYGDGRYAGPLHKWIDDAKSEDADPNDPWAL